jgi:adenylosuccinate synthase
MPAQNPYQDLYEAVYQRGELFGVDTPAAADPLRRAHARPNSIAVAGGAFGDEGKGRIVDNWCARFNLTPKSPLHSVERGLPEADTASRVSQSLSKSPLSIEMERGLGGEVRMIIYRWNGGANAGHTVIVDGKRVALHQLPSGALHAGATVVLGKGMVVHPGDLLAEIESVRPLMQGEFDLHIDAGATLALDTHRAFETVLHQWERGGRGSTGRGISPAYADLLLRHPVKVMDLCADDWDARVGRHYDLYSGFVGGLDVEIANVPVPTLTGGTIPVGTRAQFIERLGEQAAALRGYIDDDVHRMLREAWADERVPFVFEGAQAVGLDARWGVYPDITASDPTFDGIAAATEGIVLAQEIAVRACAIKATYTSSVGTRRLPTMMEAELAHRIREDAHEYGATTKRPRDIAYIDLPCLRFFARVSGCNALILTHLDIAYADVPIRVCTHYTDAAGELAPYRPDQAYLDTVTPHYVDLPSWDGAALNGATDLARLPRAALQYVAFLTQALGCAPLMGTTGAEREAVVSWV